MKKTIIVPSPKKRNPTIPEMMRRSGAGKHKDKRREVKEKFYEKEVH